MKRLAVILACAAAFNCGIWTTDTLALSAKNFQGECIGKFQSWKKRGGFGAAAIAQNGHCGFSWDYSSTEQAREAAISSCRFGGNGKGCVIVAENQTPSSYVNSKRECEQSSGQAKIEVCTTLIENKKDKGRYQAWNFTERGIAQRNMNYFLPAIDDFTNAIKSDRSFVWAYMNRASVRFDLEHYDAAQSDAEFALTHYKKGGDDYRFDANALLVKINEKLVLIRALPNDKLCTLALARSRKEWSGDLQFAAHIKEIKKRGFDIESCRQLVS